MIEVVGLLTAIEAADTCCKAADVELLEYENAVGACITVKIRGDVGAVTAAIEAAEAAAKRVGQVICTHVMPNPDGGVSAMTGAARANAEPDGLADAVEIPVPAQEPEIQPRQTAAKARPAKEAAQSTPSKRTRKKSVG